MIVKYMPYHQLGNMILTKGSDDVTAITINSNTFSFRIRKQHYIQSLTRKPKII